MKQANMNDGYFAHMAKDLFRRVLMVDAGEKINGLEQAILLRFYIEWTPEQLQSIQNGVMPKVEREDRKREIGYF